MKLPKCFAIFDCKVSLPSKPEFVSYWLQDLSRISSNDNRIYNIYDFETFKITINVDACGEVQERLTELTSYVEKSCPFAKKLGVDGIGEGIVWRYWYGNGQRWIFKTKGDEHKVTKEKHLIPIDTEKVQSIKEFVNNCCTENRFNQAIEHIYKINPESPLYNCTPKMKDILIIINWVRDDILKEEMDTILENNIITKDIIPEISKKVAVMFKKLI